LVRRRIIGPAAYFLRESSKWAGLMSYGVDISGRVSSGRRLHRSILKGAKPADLPVSQSTKFEFVINLQTAKGARS